MIGCLVTVFCFLIFIEYYASQDSYKGAAVSDLWTNFTRYCYKYFYYLLYLLVIAIVSYGVFKSAEAGLNYGFQYSFWVTIGLIILVLALFSNESKKVTFSSSYFDLIKTIIMYIPCIITDLIEFIKQDYTNTPSTVFIVFILILLYILFFYLVPLYKQQQYKNDGVLLVEKPAYLNKNVLSITTNELKEKVFNQRPFYDRWFQQMMAQEASKKETEKTSKTDIKEKEIKEKTFVVPPDRLTLPYYLSQEGFNSLQVEDTQLIPFHLFSSRLINDYESTEDELDPYKERNLMKESIEAHPQVLTVIEKLQYTKEEDSVNYPNGFDINELNK
jgi:hypothetical protein